MFPQDSFENWIRGKGRFSNIPDEKWNDWHWQLANRISSLEILEKKIILSQEEKRWFSSEKQNLAFSITPYFFNLIDFKNLDCPIRKQVIPRIEEKQITEGESIDPIAEERFSPIPGLVHRYPDRVLMLVSNQCASYCRYCTRSRLVAKNDNFIPLNFEKSYQYIREHKEVRDVLISGGDPFLLSDEKLELILQNLRRISHIEMIRIGSRIPINMPQRITENLCNIFKKYGPIYLSIHINHPKECTIEVKDALDKLAFSGVVLGSQTVLLRGINNDSEIIKSLMHRLLMMRVRPYYIYACDRILGSEHFRCSIKKALSIMQSLRGWTSGYAIPEFVIDAPGGGGKVPISPKVIEGVDKDGMIVFKNFRGELFRYPF